MMECDFGEGNPATWNGYLGFVLFKKHSLVLESSIWMRWQLCNYLLSGGLQPLIGVDHWEPFSFQFVMNKEQNGRKCEHTCWHVFHNPISRKMHGLRCGSSYKGTRVTQGILKCTSYDVGPPLKVLKLLKEFFFCVLQKVGFSGFGALYCFKYEAFCFCLNRTKPLDKYKNQCTKGCQRYVSIYISLTF
jgi:hypothetical protein